MCQPSTRIGTTRTPAALPFEGGLFGAAPTGIMNQDSSRPGGTGTAEAVGAVRIRAGPTPETSVGNRAVGVEIADGAALVVEAAAAIAVAFSTGVVVRPGEPGIC